MNKFDALSIDELYIIKQKLLVEMEDIGFDELEEQFRYICFQIFKKDPYNYNGDYFREFQIDYIDENGEYDF